MKYLGIIIMLFAIYALDFLIYIKLKDILSELKRKGGDKR